MKETKYWLWLTMIFGTANRRLWEAMNLFAGPVDAYEEISSGGLNEKLSEKELENLGRYSLSDAADFLAECESSGICVAGYGDNEYPPQLRHILNPPAVLYYKGNISCLKGARTVTAVGTRNPSDYGMAVCDRICRSLAKCGIVIVSGFAVGLDITAHLAAASENRPTACILGCGIDVDYPRDNVRFREQILNSGGVFISEYPPKTQPNSPNFPKRNRILSALGKAVIVFEAAKKSGSLITAGLAAEQGRDVFCIPPADIFSSSFSGNIALLREGAQPLYAAADVLECFKFGGSIDLQIRREAYSGYFGFSSFGVGEITPKQKHSQRKKKSADTTLEAAEKIINSTENISGEEHTQADKSADTESEEFGSLNELQKKITNALSGRKVHADVIAQELGISAAELIPELTELQLLGIVKELPGKLFGIA